MHFYPMESAKYCQFCLKIMVNGAKLWQCFNKFKDIIWKK